MLLCGGWNNLILQPIRMKYLITYSMWKKNIFRKNVHKQWYFFQSTNSLQLQVRFGLSFVFLVVTELDQKQKGNSFEK